MADDEFAPYREDFGLLVEAGFVATKQCDERGAVDLFVAATVLEPESAAPIVGLGFVALNKLELKDAEELFTKALKLDPGHHLAKAFLGVTYLLIDSKRAEGEKFLEEALKQTDDPTIKNMVKTSMEWAKNDLTKKKAPFFGTE